MMSRFHSILPRFMVAVAAILIVLSLPPGAGAQGTGAQVRVIADDAALRTALRENLTGQVLELAAGVYAPIALRAPRAPSVIRSADVENPAVILGLTGSGVQDLRLEDLVFDYRFESDHRLSYTAFALFDCADIVFRNNRFEGDLAQGLGFPHDGHGYGFGLRVDGCENLLVEGNVVRHFHKGLNFRDIDGLVVRGNEVTALRMDGMTFAQVRNVQIESNYIHSFDRVDVPEDHADMIQFWTTRTNRPSENVVIRGNILDSGPGLFTQSIHMRNAVLDRGEAGDEMFYRNFTVEENLIVNAHLHGIMMGHVDGVVIRANTLIQTPASVRPGEDGTRPLYNPRITIRPQSRNVQVEGNIAFDIMGFENQPDWTLHDNIIFRGRNGVPMTNVIRLVPGVAPNADARARWAVVPDGPGDQQGIGAALLRDN